MHWICGSFNTYVFNSTCKESHPMTCLGLCRHRGEGGGTASSHLWSAPRPGRFTAGKDPVPVVTGGWVGPGPVWTGAENLTLTRIRSPDGPDRSESLYRLSCPPRMPYAGNLNLQTNSDVQFTLCLYGNIVICNGVWVFHVDCNL